MRAQSVVFRVVVALLLLPALILTAFRFAQPGWGTAVRAVGYTPYALPLYFLAFLLLLVPLILRSSGRRVVALLTALSLAGVVTHAVLLAPQFTGSSADPGQPGQEFRVMTANIYRGQAEPADVVRIAAEQRVRILVLQEVTPEALAELEESGLAELYAYRAGEAGSGTSGTMVFSDARLRTVGPLETGLGGWAVEAVMQQGLLRLYAVHPRPPEGDADEWADDHDAIIEAADEDPDLDLIVGGFNATPDHWALHELADLDFHSAAERTNSGWQPTWPDQGEQTFLGIPLPRLVEVDHVLVGRSMAAVATNSVELPGSDHRALIAEVGFR